MDTHFSFNRPHIFILFCLKFACQLLMVTGLNPTDLKTRSLHKMFVQSHMLCEIGGSLNFVMSKISLTIKSLQRGFENSIMYCK